MFQKMLMYRPLMFWFRLLALVLIVWSGLTSICPIAQAAVDPYVARYLRATEPVSLNVDGQGNTRLFSAADLTVGKQLFERNCQTCHVGGVTLPDPTVSLSLEALKGATPPRDTLDGLVAFVRQPMTYDGSEEALFCRRVPESWLSDAQVERLAGFILRAAQVAPGWGTETFQN